VAAGISAWVLPWNLDHLGTSAGWEASWKRFGSFLRAFSTPDLSPDTLRLAARLAAETLAIAILGVGLGLVLAYPMAVAASSAVLGGGAPARGPSRALGYVVREGARLALDILRGIPDFAWALVLLTIFGPTAVTATLAIAVHVAGILGKIFSELWDSVPEGQVEVLRATGAGRLRVLLYGIQPMAGSGMLSFLLMRFECAVRNASVIGAVSGGGLGASIMQELGYDNKGRAVTFLVAALMLTVSADLLSNLLRGLVRRERSSSLRGAQRRRRLAGAAVVAAIGLSFFWVRQPIADLPAELGRMDLGYLRRHFGQLLRPDFSAGTLLEALQGMLVPLGLGVLATLFAYVAAACFAWLGSATFQIRSHAFMPERSSRVRRVWRLGLVLGARTLTAVLRGVPEVAWVWILALFFLTGIEAALGALLIHSAGVLARVFTETVDNIPYRRLEAVGAPGRASAFTHGALPMSRADWRSYALFQFESNVRTGVVLGIVGVGGLGHLFRRALAHRAMDRCATFLIALVLLTLVIDRLSRRIQSGPRC
jgi:phosphonate transport system permease protein